MTKSTAIDTIPSRLLKARASTTCSTDKYHQQMYLKSGKLQGLHQSSKMLTELELGTINQFLYYYTCG